MSDQTHSWAAATGTLAGIGAHFARRLGAWATHWSWSQGVQMG